MSFDEDGNAVKPSFSYSLSAEIAARAIRAASKRKRDKGETDGEPCTITAPDGTTAQGKIVDGKCVIPDTVKESVLIPINPFTLPIKATWRTSRTQSPFGSYVELRSSEEAYEQPPLYWPTPKEPDKPKKPCDDGDNSTLDFFLGGAIGSGSQVGVQVNNRYVSIYTGVLFGKGVAMGATGSKSLPAADGLNYNGSLTLPPPFPASGTVSGPINLESENVLKDAWTNRTYGGGAALGAGVMGGLFRSWRWRFRCN